MAAKWGGGAILKQIFIATESHYQQNPPMQDASAPLTLCSAKCGQRLRILSLAACAEDCVRLRELGFCESSELRKISDGAAILCSLYGMRLALGHELGARVLVEPVAA
jgi:Fe2+ transport system protein FeoA